MRDIWEAVYTSNGGLWGIWIVSHCCEGRPAPDCLAVCLNLAANTIGVCCTGVMDTWGWTDVESGKKE